MRKIQVPLCLAILLLGTSAFAPLVNAQELQVKELAEGLSNPWGMAFLPDGSIILTERSGNIRRYSANKGLSEPLANVPEVAAAGQGGLLDITLDPDFSKNQVIYFCYSRAGEGGSSSSVAKATLGVTELKDVSTIFVASPLVDNGFHFGCRLAFDSDKNLYVTLGDRYSFKEEAQNTDNHLGSIVRIHRDGSVPSDNPFVDGKAPEIFSYGHRNVQGLTVHPETGELWAMEHGPQGGDEVNQLAKGKNYGWPKITYGIDYNGDVISDKTEMEGMEQPVVYWDPSIAPSGMAFYHGDVFKDWQGDLLVGSLKFNHLRHIAMDGDKPGEETEYLRDRKERIRDVEVGPDGLIYLLTDAPNGKLLQVSPAKG
ncbi:PQQ-dependent sugar dehydrogenase [Alteromonas pelagimontana]|uniref:PQQ-dependent sugar dehydrogenase n=1 Tax=Alteromonas pelagimontana TaxID=1858656 RepID=A0A6M4MBA7_9ALTE|nr:PQQ-dependent sugar dehydrogenase [Alteromonas pelagimontana]QJR80494.1 PQQ-dependent sugar dehydrogenase [Alteromonas pelagimontana]